MRTNLRRACDCLGGVDTIVIRQPDGALRASPFYVRFGNAQSFLRVPGSAKVITVTVNGTLTDLTMRLGSNGEAYFADGVDDFDDEEEEEDAEEALATELAEEASAVEALSALRLDTTPPKSAKREVGESSRNDIDSGVEKPSAEEVSSAMEVLGAIGIAILPMLELSVCGGKVEDFDKHLVSPEQFRSNPGLLNNTALVVRPRREANANPAKALPWSAAAPHVLGHLAFGTPLPSNWKPTPATVGAVSSVPSTPVRVNNGSDSSLDSMVTRTYGGGTSASVASSPGRGTHRVRRVQLTQEEVMSLDLKPGLNTIQFSFNSRVWGLQEVSAFVYLWDWNIKLVITDVDGTITKSDVLGHLAPMIGKDWSHDGVAALYSDITDNGYKLMFLTARAISHASGTRKYLSSLKQGDKTMSQGPVMCAPDPLSKALFREVVTRNPQQFKIRCLQDIRSLFPAGWNPFHAGFGNRSTDVESYEACGVPQHRIFTINPKGEVVAENTKRVKQYTLSEVNELVHEMFPAVQTAMENADQYNDFNHWRQPTFDDKDCGVPI